MAQGIGVRDEEERPRVGALRVRPSHRAAGDHAGLVAGPGGGLHPDAVGPGVHVTSVPGKQHGRAERQRSTLFVGTGAGATVAGATEAMALGAGSGTKARRLHC